jgi:hypothetical protein
VQITQEPQIRGVDDQLDTLGWRPAPRCAGVLDGGAQPLSAGEIKTKVKVLAQIGYVGDARGYSVLTRHGASAGRLDVDPLGPQQDRHFGDFALDFGLVAAAQPQSGLGGDNRAGLAPFDNPASQHVGAADELGDEGTGRARSYISAGVPICSIRPCDRTAMRSDKAKASVWSCVT